MSTRCAAAAQKQISDFFPTPRKQSLSNALSAWTKSAMANSRRKKKENGTRKVETQKMFSTSSSTQFIFIWIADLYSSLMLFLAGISSYSESRRNSKHSTGWVSIHIGSVVNTMADWYECARFNLCLYHKNGIKWRIDGARTDGFEIRVCDKKHIQGKWINATCVRRYLTPLHSHFEFTILMKYSLYFRFSLLVPAAS